MKKLCCLLTALTLALGCAATALAEEEARTAFIDKIIETAKETFDDAGGRLQRAQYSGDIYICKNFTVYLFRQTRDAFRMAEFPDVPLVIPDNLTKKDSAPYAYGISWKDVSAAEGNPFEVAATFKYDTKLSKAENEQLAHDFEDNLQNAGLRVVEIQQTRQKQWSHIGYGCAHRMTGFSVYIPENRRVGPRLIIFHADAFQTFEQFFRGNARRSNAGKIALDVGHKNGDADGGEGFGHFLQRNGFAGSRGSGNQAVTVGHLWQ